MSMERNVESGGNPDGRSGGMGRGTLEPVTYTPPPDWHPRIITSTASGVEIAPADSVGPADLTVQKTGSAP